MESTRQSLLYQFTLLVVCQDSYKIKIVGHTKYNVTKALVCLLYKTSMSWLFEDLIHWSRISFIIFHVWGVAVTKATVQSRKIQNLILFAWNFFFVFEALSVPCLLMRICWFCTIIGFIHHVPSCVSYRYFILLYIFGYVQLTFEPLNYWTVSLSDVECQ